MERLRRDRDDSYPDNEGDDIDIIPLVDVMLLLLTFFILVTLSMVVQEGVNVSLAEAETGESVKNQEPIVVSVRSSGEYFLNEREVSIQSLLKTLRQQANQSSDRPVYLNADKAARHKYVIKALDTIRKSGLSNVTFTVKPDN